MDTFDQLCECALICMTPADLKLLEHCTPEYEQNWKRIKVNAGARATIADADCNRCQGTGQKPS